MNNVAKFTESGNRSENESNYVLLVFMLTSHTSAAINSSIVAGEIVLFL